MFLMQFSVVQISTYFWIGATLFILLPLPATKGQMQSVGLSVPSSAWDWLAGELGWVQLPFHSARTADRGAELPQGPFYNLQSTLAYARELLTSLQSPLLRLHLYFPSELGSCQQAHGVIAKSSGTQRLPMIGRDAVHLNKPAGKEMEERGSLSDS